MASEVKVDSGGVEGIADALVECGTDVLFGVPGGGSNLDLIGACEAAGLRFVLTHSETPGAIMAATYAELAGRPGACLATRGPGATSIATGVAHAWLDRCPVLAVTDTVPDQTAGRISHQRLPQDRLLGACAKLSVRAGATRSAARGALGANARRDRPGRACRASGRHRRDGRLRRAHADRDAAVGRVRPWPGADLQRAGDDGLRASGGDRRRARRLSSADRVFHRRLAAGLRKAATNDGPYLLDVAVDPSSYSDVLAAIRGLPRSPNAEGIIT